MLKKCYRNKVALLLLNPNKEKQTVVKTKINALKSLIKNKKRELAKEKKLETAAINKWVSEYKKYTKAVDDLVALKIHGTEREKKIKNTLSAWKTTGTGFTKKRDSYRANIQKIEVDLVQLGLELARLTEQEYSQVNADDQIVKGVLDLTKTVVGASTAREEYLKRQVFPRLFGKDGKLLSQVTFFSSDGLHKVQAMVNTMTLVVGDLAIKAQDEIEAFFKKFENSHMDGPTKVMYELTKQILVEKIKFKIGPHLYRFLSLELDENIFPELALAQRYLRQSIRSEKTNSYIRIYSRKSRNDKFVPIPQS